MEEGANKNQIGLKWSLIFGLVGTVVFTVPAVLRLTINFQFLLYWAYFITILTLALKEFKRDNGNYMSFGEGFGLSMRIALIGGLIRAVVRYIYLIVDSEYFEFAKEASQNNPFGPQPESGQDISGIMDVVLSPEVFALTSFVGAIFGGLLFGAIVAAIVKNEEEEF